MRGWSHEEVKQVSPEVRERAVRLVQEHRGEYPSLWAAVESIAPKIGCVPQTLLEWVKQTEVDAGARPGVSAYFSPSWTPFQADRGRHFSVIVDGVSV